ncbi:MAG: 1-acyl-sn-glycerol-3-phosphate acyltransferase [Desulfovibrio sp.]|jgi:1-acyl-sn-glycerol-3-phosphate acyltransferase|nr:1-acyl-sn-glycerol-3-phosphate acyltransferase [Desulfovibrio sp.]
MKPHVENVIPDKFLTGDSYLSPAAPARLFGPILPTMSFIARLFLGPVLWLCGRARFGRCDDAAWVYASVWVTDILERMGGRIEVKGMDAIDAAGGPCVFVANHMSTLETFTLPAIIRPRRPVTFVVKESLTTMRLFGPVMRSRDPIVVGRKNPRDDLVRVLIEGEDRLARGVSVIVFPQSTRSPGFDPAAFNSIGVKLARRADVPIVPIALKTDIWGSGKRVKELGKIVLSLPVHYQFAPPMRVEGQGRETHAAICEYIGEHVARWQREDGCNPPMALPAGEAS